MKIALCTASFFPDSAAGTEVYVLNLAKELQLMGNQIFIIAPIIHKKSVQYYFEGIEVYRFTSPLYATKQELTGIVKPCGIDEFTDILKKLSPDIVHFHSFNRAINYYFIKESHNHGFINVFTSHLGGIFCVKNNFLFLDKYSCNGKVIREKCLQCVLSQKKIPFSKPTAFFLDKFLLRISLLKKTLPSLYLIDYKLNEFSALKNCCNQIFALTNWMRDVYHLNELYNIKITEQGVRTIFFKHQSKNQILNKSILKILFVGRLIPEKGFHLLLEAAQRIGFEKISLRIITFDSDTEYYRDIKKQVLHYGNNFWHTNISTTEIIDYMDVSDVLCIPSIISEAAPLVIQEAFARCIPVIGANHTGIADAVIHGSNGFLFEKSDINQLENILRQIILNPAILEELKRNITKPKSFKDIALETIEIYKNIIKP